MRIKRLDEPVHIANRELMQKMKMGCQDPLVDDIVSPEIASKLENVKNGWFLIINGSITKAVCRHNNRFVKVYDDISDNKFSIDDWKRSFLMLNFKHLNLHELNLLKELRRINLSTKEQDELYDMNISMRRSKREMLKTRKRFLEFKKMRNKA